MRKRMGSILKNLRNRWKQADGQDLVEYALLLVLVVLGAVASIKSVGTAVASDFTRASDLFMPGSSIGPGATVTADVAAQAAATTAGAGDLASSVAAAFAALGIRTTATRNADNAAAGSYAAAALAEGQAFADSAVAAADAAAGNLTGANSAAKAAAGFIAAALADVAAARAATGL